MSQQGGRPTRQEDDWWGQLYDDSTEDTGPTSAPDSLDDRFASAKGTLGGGTAPEERAPEDTPPPPPTHAPPPPGPPTIPPPATPADPTTVPPGPGAAEGPANGPAPAADAGLPPDAVASSAGGRSPRARTTSATGGRSSTETPVTAVPASRMPPDSPPPPTAPPRPTGPPIPSPVPEPTTVEGEAPSVAPGPQPLRTATHLDLPALPPQPSQPPQPPQPPVVLDYVGSGPPTYDAEPTALPLADPDDLDDLVADTVLDGARYGACTLRAVSARGDSARYRGEPRRDSLLTARFGTGEHALVLVAMATGARATPGAHRAAAEACHWIGRAVGRSHARLAEDIRGARRGELKSGLHRLTDRSLGKLRASAAEQGIDPEEYSATLRCLLLPAHPDCRTRVFFGVGDGGLFRLRNGEWQDIEPHVEDATGDAVVGFGSLPPETPEGDRLTMDLGIPTPPSPYEPAPEPPREPFRFRASVARTGDVLLMCTGGLADPLRGEPELSEHLSGRWSEPAPPGLAAFLADTGVRVKGYADDRTAAAVWEA